MKENPPSDMARPEAEGSSGQTDDPAGKRTWVAPEVRKYDVQREVAGSVDVLQDDAFNLLGPTQ